MWIGMGLGAIGTILLGRLAMSQPVHTADLRPPRPCPSELETLVPLLLEDLPSYTNRVIQRSLTANLAIDTPGIMLLTSAPDYTPLPLSPIESAPPAIDDPQQVFFTMLERRYTAGAAVRLQHYHRVFFTETSQGWRLALMQSSIGDYPARQPASPPYDSGEGATAQAIRLWLRDCYAGAIE